MKTTIKKIAFAFAAVAAVSGAVRVDAAGAVIFDPVAPAFSQLTYQSAVITETVDIPNDTQMDTEIHWAKSIADLNDPAKRKSQKALQASYPKGKRETIRVPLENLDYDTKYYFKFVDTVQNVGGGTYFFQTAKLPTLTFSPLSGTPLAGGTSETITGDVTFSTGTPKTTALLYYGTDSDTGLPSHVNLWLSEDKTAGQKYSFSKTVTGLKPATRYFYQVVVTYPVSRIAKSGMYDFTNSNPVSAGGGSNPAPAQALEFKDTPSVTCFENDQFCSVNVSIKGLVSGVLDTVLTAYPQSEVSKDPSDPSKWQKGVVLAPQNTLAANNVAITPGGAIVLSSSASYADLKALPAKSGTSDTVFVPLLSYKLKSGGGSGIPNSAVSPKGAQAIDASKVGTGTAPVVASSASGAPSQVSCGAANGKTFSTAPDNALCVSPATAGSVTAAAPSGWTWNCTIVPYADANCRANQSSTAPKGSDPIVDQQGTGSGSVNLGDSDPAGGDADSASGTDASGGDDSNLPRKYLQNPFKNLKTIPDIIKAVMNNIILPVAVPFIAIMIIYSGFLFVIAKKESNTYNLERAKNTFRNTMIGAALILGAFVIANALQATLNALLK